MKLPRRRRRDRPLVPLASMGDIAFLLIIFFMVTSIFIQEAHLKVTPARSPDIEELGQSMLSVVLDSEGALWLQGEPCHPDSLEAAVAALLHNRDDNTVMLTVDRHRRHREFGGVIMALSEAGAEIALIGNRDSLTEQER